MATMFDMFTLLSVPLWRTGLVVRAVMPGALAGPGCCCDSIQGVDGDAASGEFVGQRAGEVVNRSLRGRVGICAVGHRLRAHDRAEIDDAGRVLIARRLFLVPFLSPDNHAR